MDRYPATFAFVHASLLEINGVRILSFGCSTGEEVFTLRGYFPEAEIVGLDINHFNILICYWRLFVGNFKKIKFRVAGSSAGEDLESYDAIFCMAVFRHGALSTGIHSSCVKYIDFSLFSASITSICRCIKPGGYLALRHSNFRFEDVPISSEFECVFKIDGPDARKSTPIYDSKNMLLNGYLGENVVYRKRST
jgi:hypothetical protein